MVVRLVEAQYEDGVLRPAERLSLRSGERVNLIVVRRPDPGRWDLARLARTLPIRLPYQTGFMKVMQYMQKRLYPNRVGADCLPFLVNITAYSSKAKITTG